MSASNNPAIYSARDEFTYSFLLSTLTAGSSQPGSITIDADSDFFWQKAAVHCAVAGASQQQATLEIPELTINIVDQSSGRALMNIPVAVSTIFGTAGLPFILPMERVFKSRSQISCTVYNVSAATDYSSVWFSFIGIKAFRK